MAPNHLSDLHFQYPDVVQHWHPQSQPYAGADALMTVLGTGWKTGETVILENRWFSGRRCVGICRFELKRGDETVVMPIIVNPYVERLIWEHQLQVVPAERAESAQV